MKETASTDVTTVEGSPQAARVSTPRPNANLEGLALAVTDTVTWGLAIRDGYDELYDPFYHRDLTGHAYLKGSEHEALCGYRPPHRNLFTRQRVKLGMMTPGVHDKCERCETSFTPALLASDPAGPQRSKLPVSMRFALTVLR